MATDPEGIEYVRCPRQETCGRGIWRRRELNVSEVGVRAYEYRWYPRESTSRTTSSHRIVPAALRPAFPLGRGPRSVHRAFGVRKNAPAPVLVTPETTRRFPRAAPEKATLRSPRSPAGCGNGSARQVRGSRSPVRRAGLWVVCPEAVPRAGCSAATATGRSSPARRPARS